MTSAAEGRHAARSRSGAPDAPGPTRGASRREALAAFEDRIGHVFGDPALLERALTHASVALPRRSTGHNETLEFLGDRVLGLVAAEALVGAHPEWREGELSRGHAALVSGPGCARIARRLGVGAALRLAGGATRQGGRENIRILGDAMEAVMAAVYLDGGLEAARALFRRGWGEALAEVATLDSKDAKTALQEWAMARGLSLPAYTVVSRTGTPHRPSFTVAVSVGEHAARSGAGGSLRAAQTAAAEDFLQNRRAESA